jgi:Ca2+-binding RTX toxin-like protein
MADFASMSGGESGAGDAGMIQGLANFYSDGSNPAVINLGDGDDTWSWDPLSEYGTGGSPEAATVSSTESAVSVLGGPGDDTMASGDAVNYFGHGGSGSDSLTGGSGTGESDGGYGNDVLSGGAGDDTLVGAPGNDELSGGSGNDELDGGHGDDTLVGGGGDDELTGGPGDDVFYFDSNFGSDVITDLSGGDEIWLKADLNNSGISSAADVADHVTGGVENGVSYTLISIGGDTIRIENMDADAFKVDISTWVKIQ